MSGWLPIDTAPLEDGDEYLVWDGDSISLVNVHNEEWWVLSEFTIDAPTHWQSLPSPPAPSDKEQTE